MPLTLLTVTIPDFPTAGYQEMCHEFTSNYLICRNAPGHAYTTPSFIGMNALQMLVQEIQRQRLLLQSIGSTINPGDIILLGQRYNGMLQPSHSMIAITQTLWFGVNNGGTFNAFYQAMNIPPNSLSGRREIDLSPLLPTNFDITNYQLNLQGLGVISFDVYR